MTDSASVSDPEMSRTLPYREMTDTTYSERVADSFAVEEPEPGTLILRGPCPRCGAIIDIPVVDGIFRLAMRSTTGISRAAWGWKRKPAEGPSSHVEPMICTCEDPHPGRPDDDIGCGAYWTLTVSPNSADQ